MGYNSEKQFEDDLVKMLFEQKGVEGRHIKL